MSGRDRGRTAHLGVARPAGCAVLVILLSGCLAQQADLNRISLNLDKKIARLDQREKEIDAAVKQANELITQQKKEVDYLVSETRAKLRQEITELREEDLPSIRGNLDKNTHAITTLRSQVDDLEHRIVGRLASIEKAQKDIENAQNEQVSALKADRDRLQEELGKVVARLDTISSTTVSLAKTLEGRLAEHDKAIGSSETQARALAEQISQFGRALSDFKQALTGLGDRLIQEEKRANDLAANVVRRTDALAAKVDTDAKATTAHLTEVNKSVGSVAKALETTGQTFLSQLQEQERRLEETTKTLHALNAQIQSLTQAVAQLRQDRHPPRDTRGAKPKRPASLGKDLEREQGPARGAEQVHATPSAPAANGSEAASSRPAGDPVTPEPAQTATQEPRTESAPDAAQDAARHAEKAAYERHLRKFKQGDLDGALHGFAEFLTRHPASGLAPNAQYWVGECYYGKKEFERAIEAFNRVQEAYPASEKVPAALLKKGFAYLALHDRARASSVLQQVVDAYPKTPEAGRALDKLMQLRRTG